MFITILNKQEIIQFLTTNHFRVCLNLIHTKMFKLINLIPKEFQALKSKQFPTSKIIN